MRKFIASLVLLAATLTGVAVQAQTNDHFYFASDFNKWSIQGQGNVYTFNAPTACIVNPYNSQFVQLQYEHPRFTSTTSALRPTRKLQRRPRL